MDQNEASPYTGPSMRHDADTEKHSQNVTEDIQAAEYHYRLRRMEANEGTLVNQVEDQAGDPPEKVAQQSSHIFRHSCLGGHGRRRRRCSGSLGRAASGTKGGVVGYGGSAFRTVWHGIPPQEWLRLVGREA
jgi:hypothetical protein